MNKESRLFIRWIYRHIQLLPQILWTKLQTLLLYNHADIATISSDLPGCFLIPDATELSLKLPVICVGYPRKIELKRIQEAYNDVSLSHSVLDLDEYYEIFQAGVLSVSPGPVYGYNNHVVAAQVSTTRWCSNLPHGESSFICGSAYRVRKGKNYAFSVSVRYPAFHKLYPETVVPFLRKSSGKRFDQQLPFCLWIYPPL